MDELLKAVTTLINTGGALADDALYLYFAFKVASAAAIPAALYVVLRGVRECIRVGMNAGARNSYLQTQRYFAENPHGYEQGYIDGRLAEARRVYESA